MQNSKNWMKENGYDSKISFKDGSAHTVKLLKDKVDSIPDGRGGTIKGMKYLVEENGEQKTIFTGSVGLISKLVECEEGDVVTIQMKNANNKSFFTVTKAGQEVGEKVPLSDEEETSAVDNPEW